MLPAIIATLTGLILLLWSADRFVEGAASVARHWGMSALLIGMLVVGFGTSAPEMVVSALASLEGNPSLAIGNALGSNIANIGLILGLTGLVYPMTVERSATRREIPMLAAVTVLTAILMLDGAFSRIDGIVLFVGLVAFLIAMLLRGRHSDSLDAATEALLSEITETLSVRAAVLWTLVGLIVLPLSAKILVDGAVGLASLMGVSEAVIGLTVVALGTSLPELAAAIASAVRKEDDLCIGNILGSNLFNLLGVLGIAALIHPMVIEPILILRDLPVMAAVFLLLAGMAFLFGKVSRIGAGILLSSYVVYQIAVFAEAL